MFVPLTHTGVKGWIFNFVCPGNAMSATHERLLLLKSATVNRNLGFDEVCKEKHVYVGYNNEQGWFGVSKGKLEKLPLKTYVRYHSIAQEPEIQELFFKSYNITPHWINCNFTWGTLDYTTGQWSGGVGLIQRDEADYALHGYAGTYGRSKVAAFSPGTSYMPFHWLTRYPLKLAPVWNLIGLFTKGYNSQMSKLKLIQINKHCEILVSCSDKERNCIQAHENACKLMNACILDHSETFWNILHAFRNILEHSACIPHAFWNIQEHFACILKHS